ncbi:hypothetical protein NLI96_g12603 [Meripilus lineatus]|uniref:Uncharacterized protein n=1 Tax=Meripilus lineatus TaxID=2056292 RepID=A0AAD5UPI3_9APHY|nr:hypothetical protein NLI96_g12603 [Physisporinus lineatus]
MLHLSNITLVPTSTSLKMPDKLRTRLAIKLDKPNPKKALKNMIVKKPRAAVGKIKSGLAKAKAKQKDDTHTDISVDTTRASPAPSDASGASGETTLECSEVGDGDLAEVKVMIRDDSAVASPTLEVDEVLEEAPLVDEVPLLLDDIVVVKPPFAREDDDMFAYSGRIIVETSSVVGSSSEDTQIGGNQEDDENAESAQSDENDSEDDLAEETADILVDTLKDAPARNEDPPPPMTEEEEENKDNLETMARILQGALAGRRALDRDQDFLWFNVPIFKGKLFMLVQPDDVPDMVCFSVTLPYITTHILSDHVHTTSTSYCYANCRII